MLVHSDIILSNDLVHRVEGLFVECECAVVIIRLFEPKPKYEEQWHPDMAMKFAMAPLGSMKRQCDNDGAHLHKPSRRLVPAVLRLIRFNALFSWWRTKAILLRKWCYRRYWIGSWCRLSKQKFAVDHLNYNWDTSCSHIVLMLFTKCNLIGWPEISGYALTNRSMGVS